MVLIYILTACFLISAGSLIGIFFLSLKKDLLEKIILYLVSLSAGTLIGGAFFHLIPESLETLPPLGLFSFVLVAFAVFYFIEKLLHWRHCHKENCEIHTFGYMNLIGDGIHNFIDGLIIAATFLIDIKLGIISSLAIALHEIPQEIGDFGVLIHAGFKKTRALALNFLTASLAILGGLIGYFLVLRVEWLMVYLLPLAAGGFLYISTSDLIPEIRKETNINKGMISFAFFLLGIVIMQLMTFIR